MALNAGNIYYMSLKAAQALKRLESLSAPLSQ
jgi:hypothetical protein